MKHSRKQKQLTDDAIPTASLIDISFLLVIFFILTTTFQKGAGFLSDMPAGEAGQQETPQKTPTITLQVDKMAFNDKAVTIKELRQELLGLHLDQKSREEKVVLLEASGTVPYQDYFEVMAAISSASGSVAILREKESKKQ